jgi:hypothetical protein
MSLQAGIYFSLCRAFQKRTLQGIPQKAAAVVSQENRCRLGYISAPAEDSNKEHCRAFPEKPLQGFPKMMLQAGIYFSPCRGL